MSNSSRDLQTIACPIQVTVLASFNKFWDILLGRRTQQSKQFMQQFKQKTKLYPKEKTAYFPYQHAGN